jgi:hypothetical protein
VGVGKRTYFPAYTPSYDNRFYGNFPLGNRPAWLVQALARSSADASLNTVNPLSSAIYSRASLLGGATTQIQLASKIETEAIASGTLPSSGVAQDGAFTFVGSNFGSKTTATPLLRDRGEAATNTLDNQWTGGWPNASTSQYNLANRDLPYTGGGTSIGAPHSYVQRIMTGTHITAGNGNNGGWNVAPWYGYTRGSFPFTSFWSVYTRCEPTWVFGLGSPGDDNFKVFDFSNQFDPYGTGANWYLENQFPRWHSATDVGAWHFNDDGGSLEQNGGFIDAAGHSWTWDTMTQLFDAGNGWIKWEIETCYTNVTGTSTGYCNVWDNCVKRVGYIGATDRYSGTDRSECLGGYARSQGSSHNVRMFADIYYDQSAGRFVPRCIIGNAATYSACTVREPQVCNSWSTGAVSGNLHKGKLLPGINYGFILNSSGQIVVPTNNQILVQ